MTTEPHENGYASKTQAQLERDAQKRADAQRRLAAVDRRYKAYMAGAKPGA